MGLSTTTAGYFPLPVALRRARWRHAEGEIGREELQAEEDRALRSAIELQETLGVDALVDGQFERGDLVGFLAGRLEGLAEGGLVRCWGNRYYKRPRIVEAVRWTEPLTVDRWSAAATVAARPPKAVLTGPYTLLDWSFDEHYASREACCQALAEAVAHEVAALVEAGATEIQIDEPALTGRPDELPWIARAWGLLAEASAGKARLLLRCCYGDLTPILDAVLSLPADGLYLELAHRNYELVETLPDWPADKILVAGVIDVLSEDVEPVETVRGHVQRLLKRIPRDRLVLGTDSGLRTLRQDLAEAKLRSLVAAAAAC